MQSPAYFVRRIVQGLQRGGDQEIARSNQRFFKEPVKHYGWRTAELRRYAAEMRSEIEAAGGQRLLLEVADRLFHSKSRGEEAHAAIMLLEPYGRKLLRGKASFLGAAEFRRFERWIPLITSWDECDDLCFSLLGPMILADSSYLGRIFVWARSPNRWSRRVACAALVQSVRRKLYTQEVFRLAGMLLGDEDDMVRKGLGWLLREMGKANTSVQVPFLMRIKDKAPRLVLRVACEKLTPKVTARVLRRE